MLGVLRGHFWCTCPCCAGNRSWWDQHGWRQMQSPPPILVGPFQHRLFSDLWYSSLLGLCTPGAQPRSTSNVPWPPFALLGNPGAVATPATFCWSWAFCRHLYYCPHHRRNMSYPHGIPEPCPSHPHQQTPNHRTVIVSNSFAFGKELQKYLIIMVFPDMQAASLWLNCFWGFFSFYWFNDRLISF